MYPLLVNANGTPDYGAPARLDDARFLLPVIGVPPEPAANPSADALADVVAPDTSKPVRLTMMWPLGDRPRLAPGAPGGTTPVRLIDDELATSLADRRPARRPAVGSRLRDQPDRRPRRPGAQRAVPGRRPRPAGHRERDDGRLRRQRRTRHRAGHADTSRAPARTRRSNWLNRLKALAQRMCVAPANYAQADLDALQRVGDAGPERDRHQRRRRHRRPDPRHHLDARRHPGRRRPADRPGDLAAVRRRARRSRSPRPTSAPSSSQDGEAATADVDPVRYTPQLVAAPFDPTVSAALAGVG